MKPPQDPSPISVVVSFQVNGKPKAGVDRTLRDKVIKVLRAAKLVVNQKADEVTKPSNLKVIVNNIGDLSAAGAKGVATGLTFGLAGSEVVDNYEMTAIFTPADGTPITKMYKHAIHSTIGVHSAPPGLEPVPRELAFDQVVEDMVLNLLSDLQKQGAL